MLHREQNTFALCLKHTNARARTHTHNRDIRKRTSTYQWGLNTLVIRGDVFGGSDSSCGDVIMKDNGEASVLGGPLLGIQFPSLLISCETKLFNFPRAQFSHLCNEAMSTSVFLKM